MNKLSECKQQDRFNINYLDGTDEQIRHLKELGFIPSSIVSVINTIDDNMIVQVFNSRIAINSEVSDRIYGTILKREKGKNRVLSLFKNKKNKS